MEATVQPQIIPSSDSSCLTSDSTYIEASYYIVTLDKQGGVGGTDSVLVQLGEVMPAASAPTKSKYVFLGYYDGKSNGVKYYNSDMSSASKWNIATNKTLYARWEFDVGYYTPGLQFTLSNNSYIVAKGTANNAEIIYIPSLYNGKAVNAIGAYGFKDWIIQYQFRLYFWRKQSY